MKSEFLNFLIICRKPAVLFAVFFICAGLFIFGAVKVFSADNDAYGWAWSSTIGWISLNCHNSEADTCSNAVYKVSLNPSNGELYGYAWSDNIGWIKFDHDSSADFPGEPKYSARVDSSTGKVSGWIRACAGTVNKDCMSASRTDGWDGWIKMGPIVFGGTDFGAVFQDNWLEGWAWGSNVVGWIKFGYGEKLITGDNPPTANNLSVSKLSDGYCTTAAHYFSWVFNDPGDTQSRFQFQIDDNADFSSPAVDRDVLSSAVSQSVLVALSPGSGQLGYNKTYYWRIKVYDSTGLDSGWILGPTFSTEKHLYPKANFSWSPSEPAVNSNTSFSDTSVCYNSSNQTASCLGSVRVWTFLDATPAFSSANPAIVKFNSSGNKSVNLKVVDSTPEAYTCNITKSVPVQTSSPKWKEVHPGE